MAEMVPFRGLRYRAHPTDGLNAVIAPPYDVISPAQRDALYNRGEFNVIRLELNREPAPARYEAAGGLLTAWRQSGDVLIADDRPAFYRYEQRFTHDGREYRRVTLVGRVRLQPLEAGVIRPHEYTMTGPKEDRLALMRATRANISPVFSLVHDVDGAFREALTGAPSAASAEGADITGQAHRIDVIDDPAWTNRLSAILADRPLYIADGHHRYETALAYQSERPDDPGAAFVMMAVAASDDPGLLILPIHRLVRPRREPADLEGELGRIFDLTGAGAADSEASIRTLAEGLGASRETLTLGLARASDATLRRLSLSDRSAVEAHMPAERSAAWKALAVNVLQYGVLDPILGIDEVTLRGGQHVEFSENAVEAVEATRHAGAPVAFLVPAITAREIIEVADAGDRMPQKSTYFYPKLGTGLVLNAHDL